MHDDQLNWLVARHAVFTTTAMHMQHPGDDYEGWRRDWAEVNRLGREVNCLIKLHQRRPAYENGLRTSHPAAGGNVALRSERSTLRSRAR